MPTLLYFGWVGERNLGDEALFAASRSLFPEYKFIRHNDFLSRATAKFARTVPAASRVFRLALGAEDSRLPITARLLRPVGGVLGGGTFLLHESPRVLEGLAAIAESMPFAIFGAGVRTQYHLAGELRREVDVQAWSNVMDASALVSVRGPHSQRILQGIGFRRATLVGDPVLSLADRWPKRRRGRKVGINVGDTSGRLWGGDDDGLHDWVRSLIRRLLRDRFEVSLVSVYPKDTPVLRRIAQEFLGRTELLTLYSYDRNVLETFRTFDLFVGQKLHSVVLAHCAYTPAVMLEYEPKCADYMASMDLEPFTFRCDRLDLTTVLAALTSLRDGSDAHQDALLDRVSHYKVMQTAFADKVRTSVSERRTSA